MSKTERAEQKIRRSLVEAFDELFRPARTRLRKEASESRVAALVRQMRHDDAETAIRVDAEHAMANGDPDAAKYLRVEPTPELLAKGRFETVEAVLAHQHDIRTTTKRRIIVPRVLDLHLTGLIDNDQLIACRWYRDCWEATGLVGQIPSTDYGKEVFAPPQSRDMFTTFMLEAQDNFRKARSNITPRYRTFFDAVVLDDVGLQRAIKLAKRRAEAARGVFKECVLELQTAYDELKRA